MAASIWNKRSRSLTWSLLLFMMVMAGAGPRLILADDQGNVDVLTGVGCMQDEAGFALNCTANDVRVANATNVTVIDDGCQSLADDLPIVFHPRVPAEFHEDHRDADPG